VIPLVLPHVTRLHETFLTMFAFERFVPSVCPFML
jgi:hypothetical protein